MTLARPRSAPIPAALRPRPAAAAPQPAEPPRAERHPTPEPVHLHFGIVVPDPRVHRLIAERVWAVGPTTIPVRLHGHVFLAPDGHPTERLGQWMRWAMVESGLVVPEDAGLVAPVQLDWGWQDHEARE